MTVDEFNEIISSLGIIKREEPVSNFYWLLYKNKEIGSFHPHLKIEQSVILTTHDDTNKLNDEISCIDKNLYKKFLLKEIENIKKIIVEENLEKIKKDFI